MNKTNQPTARYYPSTNKLKINGKSTQFYKPYIKYLFECLKIPHNATIVFKDRTYTGGLEEWLQKK